MSWGSSGVEQWTVVPLVSGSIPFPEIFGYIFTKIKCNIQGIIAQRESITLKMWRSLVRHRVIPYYFAVLAQFGRAPDF